MKKSTYPDLNAIDKLEREALERAKEELLSKGISFPHYEQFDDWETFYEAVRAYSDKESTLVTKYKQPVQIVPCETSDKPIKQHWAENL